MNIIRGLKKYWNGLFQILDDVSVDGIVDFIKKKDCKNIITMAGAGISTCK